MLMIWIRLAIAVMVFVISCVGLGYLAGFWVRRLKWPGWVLALMLVASSFFWPAIVVGDVLYGARHYRLEHPGDVDDAPAMVLLSAVYVGVPVLFALSLPLAFVGSRMARRHSDGEQPDD